MINSLKPLEKGPQGAVRKVSIMVAGSSISLLRPLGKLGEAPKKRLGLVLVKSFSLDRTIFPLRSSMVTIKVCKRCQRDLSQEFNCLFSNVGYFNQNHSSLATCMWHM